MKNKLMIGITTYNRKDIVLLSSKSLYEVDNLNKKDIYVFDDCSTEYDVNELKKIYYNSNIIEFSKNVGADKNIERAYRFFLDSDYDFFFNADSDLIFNKDILIKINKIISKLNKKEPILFSVFNTKNHLTLKDYDKDLLVKKNVGAGGCVFNKEAIKLFIKDLPKDYSNINMAVDHIFCKIISESNYNILCTKQSFVQHIGLIGQNSNAFLFDWGENFEVDSLTNAKAILKIYENNIDVIKNSFESELIKYAKEKRFGIGLALKLLLITISNKIKK